MVSIVFIIYRVVEAPCCIPETNVTLWVNYTIGATKIVTMTIPDSWGRGKDSTSWWSGQGHIAEEHIAQAITVVAIFGKSNMQYTFLTTYYNQFLYFLSHTLFFTISENKNMCT